MMDNVSASDTMVFEKDGLWWMLTNLNPEGGSDHCSELYLFYSENVMDSQWVSHPNNPIYIDPLIARNGGILFDDDQIFRVCQRQGFDQYGHESGIYRITEINKNSYKEELISNIKPNYFENLVGTHHLHSNGNITVFDFARYEKIPKNLNG